MPAFWVTPSCEDPWEALLCLAPELVVEKKAQHSPEMEAPRSEESGFAAGYRAVAAEEMRTLELMVPSLEHHCEPAWVICPWLEV